MRSFSSFLWIGTTFAFFQRLGNVFFSWQILSMVESGSTKHSFNVLMETSSHSWTFLISSVLINLHISLSSISKDYNFVSVIYVWFSGNILSFAEGLNRDQKYLLKRLAFSLKFVTIFPFTKRGGIIWIFLPL